MIRLTTVKGLAGIIVFLTMAALIEYFIVLYAINLGVRDTSLLRWEIQLPGTSWLIIIAISPLFHLVPIAVIITLLFTWIYLGKHIGIKPPHHLGKGKAKFIAKQEKGAKLNFFGKIRLRLSRVTLKSALTVFLAFAILTITISFLAYPRLVYETISNTYQNSPSLLSFVKGTAQALAPIGDTFSIINKAILFAAPEFRNFALSLGAIIKPLSDLDNSGKYLALQNIAAWISALAALVYGEYMRKGHRYRQGRKS